MRKKDQRRLDMVVSNEGERLGQQKDIPVDS